MQSRHEFVAIARASERRGYRQQRIAGPFGSPARAET
jgi:hypothetical protein